MPARFFTRGRLLAALLLVLRAAALPAQTPIPTAAIRASHRYWEADADSLRRVLATQRADTARLRTLLHLYDSSASFFEPESDPQFGELVQLTRRLRRPDAAGFRLSYAAVHLTQAEPARALDSMRAAVAVFDRVGRPIPNVLAMIGLLFRRLKQAAAQKTYFEPQLALYQARGARENAYRSHHALGAAFVYRGDYNQAISHYLHAADLAATFNRSFQENELKVVGSFYADWGNPAKALQFLRQSLAVHLPRPTDYDNNLAYTYRGMAQAYRQLHNYPAALRYARLSGTDIPPDTTRRYRNLFLLDRAYGLVIQSALLLDMHRVTEASSLLMRAQHLADSLKLGFTSTSGFFELDATWARYYAAKGEPARAEKSWLAAYDKARENKTVPLRLTYLRSLADFYAQRGQAAPAGRYARTALALSDSLSTSQGAFHVAQYEAERADQAQNERIAALRLTQLLDAAQARRQRLLLFSVLAVLALLAGLGFVLGRANRRQQQANDLLSQQKAEIQAQRDQTTHALAELRATQTQLIQKEKMASLGELTAGIAHEIQNPLNFVNNFSEVSTELMAELEDAQAAGDGEEVSALAADVRQNLGKITEHGRRAAGIVRGMLEHSRQSTGERAPVDVNALCEEYLRLAYQGLRAKDKAFNCALKTGFWPGLPLVEAAGADLGRVLLNLFGNAFYAVRQRQQLGEAGYAPTVEVSTEQVDGHIQIGVKDNGTGMSLKVQAKIFQPFFTTKPTGEGTGLGLSLSHDIISKGHGGTLLVDSREGHGTTFVITLPTKTGF